MPKPRLGQTEFIVMMASLVALTAFSIDAMLPGIGQIADELTPDAPNRAQLVIPAFALGMGIGTLFVGPFADAFGRRPVIIFGAVFYVVASSIAWAAPTLETLLAARFVQGLAAAVPRIAAIAIIRDLYSGRGMARIMSFILFVFTLIPALAPAASAFVMETLGWRAVFALFIGFSVFGTCWYILRQSETLEPEHRRPLNIRLLFEGVKEILGMSLLRRAISAQSLIFAMLFVILSSSQVIFEKIYDRADNFPYWFGLVAILAASASILNARVVERLGMRRVVLWALGFQVIFSGFFLVIVFFTTPPFILFICWMIGLFFMIGLTIGNLNALAMEPLGHLAGLAASVIGAISTVAGGALAIPASLWFDGTLMPAAETIFVFALVSFAILRSLGVGEQIKYEDDQT